MPLCKAGVKEPMGMGSCASAGDGRHRGSPGFESTLEWKCQHLGRDPTDDGRGREAVPHLAGAHFRPHGPASSPSRTLTKEGLGDGDAGSREAGAETQTLRCSPDTTAIGVWALPLSEGVLQLLQSIWDEYSDGTNLPQRETKPLERQIHVFVNVAFY